MERRGLKGSSELEWKKLFPCEEEALMGEKGDGVRFYLSYYPSCHRRGRWRLLVEVVDGCHHEDWGCFDEQDQPMRWFHKEANARDEAQQIADVLWRGRWGEQE